MIRVTESMASLNVLHADTGKNVAGLRAVNFVTVVRVHLNHTADALGFTGEGVQYGHAFFKYTRVDAHEGQRTKAVIHDFKCQGTKWFFSGNSGHFTSRLARFVCKRLWVNFRWAGQVINNRIQY